jgi:hypothetical protein
MEVWVVLSLSLLLCIWHSDMGVSKKDLKGHSWISLEGRHLTSALALQVPDVTLWWTDGDDLLSGAAFPSCRSIHESKHWIYKNYYLAVC